MADETPADRWRLVRGTNLKPEDRHVLLTLFLFQGNNAAAFCKQETLADEIGVDPRSIRRSLKRLNAAGIVRSQWKGLNGVGVRHYAIDFQKLRTFQRDTGRTPASYLEGEGRTLVSAMVGHQRPDTQDTGVLQEDPLNIQGRSRGARPQKTKFQKPTADQVREYATEQKCPTFDAGKFCDYYESNGWRVGRTAMKDWRATVRNWIRSGGTQSNGKLAGDSGSEQAWQTLKRVIRTIDKTQPYTELIRQQLKPDVFRAAEAVGFKALFSIDQFNESKLSTAFSMALAGDKNS